MLATPNDNSAIELSCGTLVHIFDDYLIEERRLILGNAYGIA